MSFGTIMPSRAIAAIQEVPSAVATIFTFDGGLRERDLRARNPRSWTSDGANSASTGLGIVYAPDWYQVPKVRPKWLI